MQSTQKVPFAQTALSSASVTAGILIGDTNGDGTVNVADIGQTKSQSGHTVTSFNFREDVTVDGSINVADIGLVTDASDARSIVGTEGYLAPEGPGTPQADLFALGKVLSPQYLIWVMPAIALLPLRPRLTLAALAAFYAALPLTQWIYPLHYGELVQLLTPLPVVVLATRNIVLVLALATLLGAFWQLPLGCFRPVGNTDSEFLFCYLLGRMEAEGQVLSNERGWHWLASQLAELNRYGKLNCLLADGRRLFCYHDAAGFKGLHFRKVHVRGALRRFEDADLRIDLAGEDVNQGFVIATHPLSSAGWQPVSCGELIVIEQGLVRFSSQRSVESSEFGRVDAPGAQT